jgi:hypothetical protein
LQLLAYMYHHVYFVCIPMQANINVRYCFHACFV